MKKAIVIIGFALAMTGVASGIKCIFCNGTGWRGNVPCVYCKGTGGR